MTYDLTTNYDLRKPTDANDDDAWGVDVNHALDTVDAALKVVADIADAAAADATAALAAVGGVATMPVTEYGGATNVSVSTDPLAWGPFTAITQTGGAFMFTFNSGLPSASKATKLVMVIKLSGGAVFTLAAGAGVTVITDFPDGSIYLSALGRHLVEFTCYRLAAGNTIILAKKIGKTTA